MAEQGIMNSQLHVLAVDDNNLDRRLIERLLRKSSYKVTTVDSGRKALEFLGLDGDANNINHVQVNMVVTDYCMPGMTGYELLKKIKDCADLTHIPVVILSSENVPARKARCLSEGAEEFIVKPVQQSDVSRLRSYMATPKCMMRLN